MMWSVGEVWTCCKVIATFGIPKANFLWVKGRVAITHYQGFQGVVHFGGERCQEVGLDLVKFLEAINRVHSRWQD